MTGLLLVARPGWAGSDRISGGGFGFTEGDLDADGIPEVAHIAMGMTGTNGHVHLSLDASTGDAEALTFDSLDVDVDVVDYVQGHRFADFEGLGQARVPGGNDVDDIPVEGGVRDWDSVRSAVLLILVGVFDGEPGDLQPGDGNFTMQVIVSSGRFTVSDGD